MHSLLISENELFHEKKKSDRITSLHEFHIYWTGEICMYLLSQMRVYCLANKEIVECIFGVNQPELGKPYLREAFE